MALLKEPIMSHLGRFFPQPPKAYSLATPKQIYEVTASGGLSRSFRIRNTWAFHAALAMLAEGVMERYMLPQQTTATMDSLGDCSDMIARPEFAKLSQIFGGIGHLSNYAELKRFTGFELLRRTLSAAVRLVMQQQPIDLILPNGTQAKLYPAMITDHASRPTGVNRWLPTGEKSPVQYLISYPAKIMMSSLQTDIPEVKTILSAWPGGEVDIQSYSYIYLNKVLSREDYMGEMRDLCGDAFYYFLMRNDASLPRPFIKSEITDILINSGRINYAAIEVICWLIGWLGKSAAIVPLVPKIKHVKAVRTITYDISREGEIRIDGTEIKTEDVYLRQIEFNNTVDSYLEGDWEIPGHPGGDVKYTGSASPTEDYIKSHLVGEAWRDDNMIERQVVDMSELEWIVETNTSDGTDDEPSIPDNPVKLIVEIRTLKPVKEELLLNIPKGWPADVLVDNGYVSKRSVAVGMFVYYDQYFGNELMEGENGYDWYPTRDAEDAEAIVLYDENSSSEEQALEEKIRERVWSLIGNRFREDIWQEPRVAPRGKPAIIDGNHTSPVEESLDIIKSLAKIVVMCNKDGETWFELNGQKIGTKDSLYITGDFVYEGYPPSRSQSATLPGMWEGAEIRFGESALLGVNWNWMAANSIL